jgi:hypothetical protein
LFDDSYAVSLTFGCFSAEFYRGVYKREPPDWAFDQILFHLRPFCGLSHEIPGISTDLEADELAIQIESQFESRVKPLLDSIDTTDRLIELYPQPGMTLCATDLVLWELAAYRGEATLEERPYPMYDPVQKDSVRPGSFSDN